MIEKIFEDFLKNSRREFENKWNPTETGGKTMIYKDAIDNYKPQLNDVSLFENELPIYECLLENGNYSLITTDRVFSRFRNVLCSCTHKEIRGILGLLSHYNSFENFNTPTDLYLMVTCDACCVFFEVEGRYPSMFFIDLLLSIRRVKFDFEGILEAPFEEIPNLDLHKISEEWKKLSFIHPIL